MISKSGLAVIDIKSILITNAYTIKQIIFLLNHKNTYHINVFILKKLNKEIRNKIKRIIVNKEYAYIQINIIYNMYLELLNK